MRNASELRTETAAGRTMEVEFYYENCDKLSSDNDVNCAITYTNNADNTVIIVSGYDDAYWIGLSILKNCITFYLITALRKMKNIKVDIIDTHAFEWILLYFYVPVKIIFLLAFVNSQFLTLW